MVIVPEKGLRQPEAWPPLPPVTLPVMVIVPVDSLLQPAPLPPVTLPVMVIVPVEEFWQP